MKAQKRDVVIQRGSTKGTSRGRRWRRVGFGELLRQVAPATLRDDLTTTTNCGMLD
jgi:hypothetical protein